MTTEISMTPERMNEPNLEPPQPRPEMQRWLEAHPEASREDYYEHKMDELADADWKDDR